MAPTLNTQRGVGPVVVETPVRCGNREASSGFDLVCPECRHRRGRSCRGDSRTMHSSKVSHQRPGRRHLLPIGTAIGGATRKLRWTASRLFSRDKDTVAGENVSHGQTPKKPDARGRLGTRTGASGDQQLSSTTPSETPSASNAPSPPSLAALTLEDHQQPVPVFTAGFSLPRTDSGYVSASDQLLPALNVRRRCADEPPLSSARSGHPGGPDEAVGTTASSARIAIPQSDAQNDQAGCSHKSAIARRLERSIGLTRHSGLPGALPYVTRAIWSKADHEPLARMSRDVPLRSMHKPRTPLAEVKEPDSFDARTDGAVNIGVDLHDNVPTPEQVHERPSLGKFQADPACSDQPPGLVDTPSDLHVPPSYDPVKSISIPDQGDPAIPLPLAAVGHVPMPDDRAFVSHAPAGGRAPRSTNWPGGLLTVNSPWTSRSSSQRRPDGSGDDDDDDDDDGDDGRRPSKPPDDKPLKGPGSDSQPKRKFACPLHKTDPNKHPGCSPLILHRLRDVKQHLRRRHLQKFYCDRCLALFVNDQTLHGHTCVPVNPPCTSPEYISARQLALFTPAHRLPKEQQLIAKENPWFAEEEGWFAMWDIIFPGIPRPESPYHESDGVEEFRSYRQYYSQYSESMLMAGAQKYMEIGAWPWFSTVPEDERKNIFQWFIHDGPRLVYDSWWLKRTSDERESNSGTPSERSGPLTHLSKLDSGVGMGAQRLASNSQQAAEGVWPVSFPDPVGGEGYGAEPLAQWINQKPDPGPWSATGAGAWACDPAQGHHAPSDELYDELHAMPSSGHPGSRL